MSRNLYTLVADRMEEEPSGELDLLKELSDRFDPAEFKPRLRDEVEIKTFRLKWGNDYAIIANPTDLIHYDVTIDQAEMLKQMDGSRTVKDIVVDRLRESGGLELDDFAGLVEVLRQGNFLTERYVDTTAIVRQAANPVSAARAKAREFAKTLSIEWSDAHRLVDWFYRHGFRFFFRPAVFVLAGLIAVLGFIAFISVYRSGRFELGGEYVIAQTIVLLVMDYVLTFLHELGHALVLIHHGRRIKSAGFMIYFGSPAFFVEATDALMLDRGKRIAQSFAGPFAELAVAGLTSIFLWAFPETPISPFLYTWSLLNYFVVFLNLIPLLELDGYWIFSDLIQVPDLRPRSLQFIRYDLWRKIRRREGLTKQEVGLATYAIVGVAFSILSFYTAFFFWRAIFGGLVSQLWNGGVVGKLFLLALALFLVGPVIRGLITLSRSMFRKLKGVLDSVRFKLQTRWRVEAALLIDSSPMFEDLPEDLLNDLAGRVMLRRFPAGKPIFRQGDRPDAFYVIRKGTLHVIDEDAATGDERVIRTLGRGEMFGELGLVDDAPRSATVRPLEDAQLFVVDESTFDRLLAGMLHRPEVEPTVQMAAELRSLRPFASLPSSDLDLLMKHGEWVNVAPGETVIREGEPGDSFYAVGSGRLGVFREDERIGELVPGSYFGEVALLSDVPRTATVVARTPSRVFRIDREAFDRVIAVTFRRGKMRVQVAVARTAHH